MTLRVTIVSDLFGDGREQDVLVQENLVIEKLLIEVRRQYNLPEGEYTLCLYNEKRVLNPTKTLEDMGVQSGAILSFSCEMPTPLAQNRFEDSDTELLKKPATVLLRAENGQTFELVKFPALIGRPNPEKQLTAAMLALDLTALDAHRSVSRPHARIVKEGAVFYVESVRQENPVYVNDKPVLPGYQYPLQPGERLRFGKVILQFLIKER